MTTKCAATAQGFASPGAAHINGAALLRARREKELKYHELAAGNLSALVVVEVETGGRLWILSVLWQEPGHGTSDASPVFVLGLASPLVEDARTVLWQGVCQLLGDLLLRHA